MVSSRVFLDFYAYVAKGRSQFGFYFFALALVAFSINIAIVITEWQKIPDWCGIQDLSSLIQRPNGTGCDELIFIELFYQGGAFIISLISSIIIAGSLTGDKGKSKSARVCLRLTYTCLVWGLLFLLALIAWSVLPTLLMAFVYPSIVISVTALIVAVTFSASVFIVVPLLMTKNLRNHFKCQHVVGYLIPLGGLFLGLLGAGLLTITYLQAAVWGSGVGGAAGLVVAVAPGLALTFFTEFYRDWFVTQVISKEGTPQKKADGSIKKKGSSKRKKQESTSHKNAEPKGGGVEEASRGGEESGGGGGGEEGTSGVELEVIVENKEPAPQGKEVGKEDEGGEGEEEEDKEEEEKNKWVLRRTSEPAHLFQQGISRIYRSGRRKKDKDDQ